MRYLIKFIASVGFLGYIPVASGTVTSAIFVVLIYKYVTSVKLFVALALLFVFLGYFVCSRAAYIFNRTDPSQVVIDEVAGLFIALLLVPQALGFYLIAFVLFRIFDIAKPPPIRNIERLRGAIGIMSDDIMAGIYANILTQIIARLVL